MRIRSLLLSTLFAIAIQALSIAADLPSGVKLPVRLDETITSDTARTGDHFTGTLDKDVKVADGVIIPRGSKVEGVVQDAENGYQTGMSHLDLELVSITWNGKPQQISTNVIARMGQVRRSSSGSQMPGDSPSRADIGRTAVGVITGSPNDQGVGVPGTGGRATVGGAERQDNSHIILPVNTKLVFVVTSNRARIPQ